MDHELCEDMMPGKKFLEKLWTQLHKDSAERLRLNPACIHYLETCCEALLMPLFDDENGLIENWHIDNDFHKPLSATESFVMCTASRQYWLQEIAQMLLKVSRLTVDLTIPMHIPGSWIRLSMYYSLRTLIFDGNSLSSYQLPCLVSFRYQLRELCITKHKLPCIAGILNDSDSHQPIEWRSLSTLRIVDCSLKQFDGDYVLFPRLHTLDLSQNQLSNCDGIPTCPLLHTLNLSTNAFLSLKGIDQCFRNITVLNVSHNRITHSHDLRNLPKLQFVDMQNNVISKCSQLNPLTTLPTLTTLRLEGNPIDPISLTTFRSHVQLDLNRKRPEPAKLTESAEATAVIDYLLCGCAALGIAQGLAIVFFKRDAFSEQLISSLLLLTATLALGTAVLKRLRCLHRSQEIAPIDLTLR